MKVEVEVLEVEVRIEWSVVGCYKENLIKNVSETNSLGRNEKIFPTVPVLL